MTLQQTRSCSFQRSTLNVLMLMPLRQCSDLPTDLHCKFKPGFVCRSPSICSLPCRLQGKWDLRLLILLTLKSMSQNIMSQCLLQLSRALSVMGLCQWSLAPRSSKGTAMYVVATCTKLCTAPTWRASHQLCTPLPAIIAKQVLARESRTLVLTICRLLLVGCSLQLLH